MEKKLIALVFVTIAAGLVGGYGLGYVIYQPQIQNLQKDMSVLNDKFDTIDLMLTNTQTSVASLEDELSVLNSEVTSLNSTVESSVTSLQDELNNLNSEVASLNSTVETMENRTWHEVYSISGSSDVTTGLFQLKGSEVRVSWRAVSTSPFEVSESYLEIWLRSSNGTLHIFGTSGFFAATDAEVELDEAGDYYLSINVHETSYTVTVWDYY